MQRILVPTDFSEQAEFALKVAADLARKHESEIYLLHLLELPIHLANSGSSEHLPESLFFIKLAEKNFKEIADKPYLDGLDVRQEVAYSEIYEGIRDAIKKYDIDLIVMGSHGASGFKEMFIGSNTEKVVRTSERPVLVIKNDHENFEIKDFVFATDFSEECRIPLNKAYKFSKAIDAKMHLLFVNTVSDFKTSDEALTMMRGFIKGMGLEDYTLNIFNDHSVEKGILNFAKEKGAQLVGMSTHGRKGLSHFFNGSISEDLVNHAQRPVITFKI